MANNGGRQGGGGGNGPMNEHVEFTVKAEEDLYLTGSENTIRRVTAETNYSCLMLKSQRFSSLFRHYAKYHGLKKDDLEYYFVNRLENDDTPESVQLQRGDTIMVRKRRKPEPPEAAADDSEFFRDMRDLLDDEEHMDVIFMVHPEDSSTKMETDEKEEADQKANLVEIRAHRCILTARTDYFKALFRKNAGGGITKVAFRESEECTINVEPTFAPTHIRYMLEFIYTNRIQDLSGASTDDLLCLLHLSDLWLLRDLKRLVEHELIRNHMSVDTVARMYGATEDFHAQRLSRACIEFIMANLRQVTTNTSFEEEMKNYPHLCIPVLKAAADLWVMDGGPATKKQRTDHGSSSTSAPTTTAVTTATLGSSPVPDTDP